MSLSRSLILLLFQFPNPGIPNDLSCIAIHLLLCFFSGQYDGLKKPLPEYHVKVAGFDERVSASSFLVTDTKHFLLSMTKKCLLFNSDDFFKLLFLSVDVSCEERKTK